MTTHGPMDGPAAALGELCYELSPAGEIRRWNDRLAETVDVEESTLEGTTLTDLVAAPDREGVAEALERVRTDRADVSVSAALGAGSGDGTYVLTGSPIESDDGTLRGIAGVAIRREAATPGDHESRFFEQVADRVGVGVGTYDDSGAFTYVNERYAELLGTTPEAMIGTPLWEFNPEFDAEQFDAYWSSFDSHETRRTETVHERADGTILPVETVSTRMSFEGEAYNVGTVKDISARKEWEHRVTDERDRMAAMFEAVPEPVAHLELRDGTPVVRRMNATFEAVFGLDQETIVDQPLTEFIVPSHLRDEAASIDDMLVEGGVVESEVQRMADEEVRDFLLRVKPFETNGNTTEYVAIYSDIAEQKEQQRSLERQREEAELLNHIVRHDIRNDMQLIESLLPMLEDHVAEPGKEYLQQIDQRSEHIVELTEIVGELMQILIEERESREIVALRETLGDQFEKVAEEYDDAEFEIDGEIPPIHVMADDMLESVFRNLLTNAVYHNDAETPEIVVTIEKSPEQVVVSVADNGPGVPDDRKTDIFGKGEKGLESQGTGIGLYLVNTLVQQYDGDVWIDDNDPRGAVFSVELDRASE